jgi:hypothetical protein
MNQTTNKIPKIIHYCWFGGQPKPAKIKYCIDSWKVNLSDYDIIEWNESNFDFEAHEFTRVAYAHKRWAHLSDFFRMWVLSNYGGVYLDADVEVLKSFNQFLKLPAFTGFENFNAIISPITAVVGSEPQNPIINRFLRYYDNIKHILDELEKPNTLFISNLMQNEYGIKLIDVEQSVQGQYYIFPSTYFCNRSPQSFSVHHFSGSWLPKKTQRKILVLKYLKSIVPISILWAFKKNVNGQ